jgi:hypothetical protein
MDIGETVAYDWGEKLLIVTVSEKTAQKMRSDGWDVHYESELGHFVRIKLEER